MPGDTPHEAVQAFLEPLRDALAVLDGHGQITPGRRGGWALDEEYTWLLNGGSGMRLGELGLFDAIMRFRVVRSDPLKHEGRYRVTTRGYWYRLSTEEIGGDVWRMHWHPVGNSPITGPHLHLHPHLGLHLPFERMSFETAIRWCIEFGAPRTCSLREAGDHLTRVETPFRLYRSWMSPQDAPR